MFLWALQQAFDAEVAVQRFPMKRVRAGLHRVSFLFGGQQERRVKVSGTVKVKPSVSSTVSRAASMEAVLISRKGSVHGCR